MGFELDEQAACLLQQRICVRPEFVGDLTQGVESCYLWNVGAIHMVTGATFSCTMNPQVRPIPLAHENCVNVTDQYLRDNGAVSVKEGLTLFFNWLGLNNVLVAHNNFKADKPVLEQACKRAGINCPLLYFGLAAVRSQYVQALVVQTWSSFTSTTRANLLWRSIWDFRTPSPSLPC